MTNPMPIDSLTAEKLLAENAALRESERRLRTLADNLPGVVLYQIAGDTSGNRRFTYISESARNVLGLSVEEVLTDARTVYAQLLPEYLPGLFAAEERSVRDNGTFNYEFQIRRPSGDVRWISLSASVCMLPDGSGAGDGILTDITARKKAG